MKAARLLAIFALASLALGQQYEPKTPKKQPAKVVHTKKPAQNPAPKAGGPGPGPNYSTTGGKSAAPSGYTRLGMGTYIPPIPSTTNVLTGDGGGGVSQTPSGVNAQSGFLQPQVLTVTGATGPSPFGTTPNGSVEWFGPSSNVYGVNAPNGAAAYFGHSGISGSSGNGGVLLGGGNSSGVGTSYQTYLNCEMTGCDFQVPITYQGGAIGGGGGSMTWPSAAGIANYSGSSTTGWNASYNNTTNPIPLGYVQQLQLASGTTASPAIGYSAAPELGTYAGPQANTAGTLQGVPLSAVSRSGNVVTATSSLGSINLPVGTTITISGVADTSFNGTFVVASVTSPSFTYNQTAANASSTGGVASPWMTHQLGYALEFNRLMSSTNNAALRGSIRFGPSDSILYGCVSCTNSIVTGFNTTDQNLITGNGSSGPVNVGDYLGVKIWGPMTLNYISGAGPYCLHIVSGVVSAAGADCNSGGTGGSMTWPSDTTPVIPIYSGTSAWTSPGYNASNPIPSTWVQGTTSGSGAVNQAWGMSSSSAQGWINPLASGLSTNGTANQFWGMGTGGTTQGWYTLTSGNGTVNSGTINQIAYYAATGTAVSGNPRLTDDGTTLNYGGAGYFTGNLKIDGVLQVKGPWLVNSIIPTGTMSPSASGQSAFGVSNTGDFYISNNTSPISKICTPLNAACANATTAQSLVTTVPCTSGEFTSGIDVNGNALNCTALSSMTWPSGSASGIPLYSGSSSWSAVYNTSNTIPPGFIPTLNQSTTGNAATATALVAATPCAAGSWTTGINTSGAAQNCTVDIPTGTGFIHVTSGQTIRDAAATTIGSGLIITSGALTTVNQQPYEIAVTFNGTLPSNQVFLRKPTSIAYTIPSGCTNSQVILGTATTASLTITLSKNGTSFGTAVIAAGTTGGNANTTWSCTSATSFSIGVSGSTNSDVLTVTAPSTADTTAAGLGASIYALR